MHYPPTVQYQPSPIPTPERRGIVFTENPVMPDCSTSVPIRPHGIVADRSMDQSSASQRRKKQNQPAKTRNRCSWKDRILDQLVRVRCDPFRKCPSFDVTRQQYCISFSGNWSRAIPSPQIVNVPRDFQSVFHRLRNMQGRCSSSPNPPYPDACAKETPIVLRINGQRRVRTSAPNHASSVIDVGQLVKHST